MDFLNFEIIEKGGPMMWPLLIMGLIGLTLSIERAIYLHKGKIRAGEFLTGIKNLLRKRRLVEALTVCEETEAPVAHVVKAALLNYDQDEGRMIGAVQEAAMVEIPNLERRVGTIAMIARVAPVVGLLGTVLGMYMGFSALEGEGAYAHMGVLSGYVKEAILSTVVGLMLSVMSLVMHHFLDGRVRALVQDMEWVGHDILQFLLRDLPEEDKNEVKDSKDSKVVGYE